MTRNTHPMPWMDGNYHDVERLAQAGHLSIHMALLHIASDWGSGPLNTDQYADLLPNDNLWGQPKPDEKPSAIQFYSVLMGPMFEPTIRPVPMMTPRDLAAWWIACVGPFAYSETERAKVIRSPSGLVQLGYLTLNERYYYESEASPQVGACLSMVGAGVIGALLSENCSLCQFRRSVFNTGRCNLCALSKRVVEPADQTKQAAQVRRTKRALGNVDLFFKTDMTLGDAPARYFAGMINSMPRESKAYEAWLHKVESSLADAPLVRSALPTQFMSMPHSAQMSALRNAIDPNEWDHSIWPVKIRQAQQWAAAERNVSARRKGPGPMDETLKKASTARMLMSQGLSKTLTAQSMGISLSHLSHILRRTSES